MAFVKRFGGWRPVQMEQGAGTLLLAPTPASEPVCDSVSVTYRFEVWHQMVDGFAGPFRSEGTVTLPDAVGATDVLGRTAILVLDDGRYLPMRLAVDGSLLGHGRPATGELPEPFGRGREAQRPPANRSAT